MSAVGKASRTRPSIVAVSRVAIAGPGAGRLVQRGEQGDDLVVGLALGVDHLGVAGADPAVMVELGETEVGEPGERCGREGAGGVIDRRRARCDGREQAPQLLGVHAATLIRQRP